ncbi:MAG: hypothetical protein HY725_08190 [Candidatus Rokubacteria bacterium]|nr:hypothetical protein [Candidatus Rokubacteria bacterium]
MRNHPPLAGIHRMIHHRRRACRPLSLPGTACERRSRGIPHRPKIANVAVVAMPDPRLQERACAFVIPKPGETPTLAEVVACLESKEIARQKFPERLEIVGEFPMTPSGKVQKFRLRELVAAQLGQPPVR